MVLKVRGGEDLTRLQLINPKQNEWLILWDPTTTEDGSLEYKGTIIKGSTPTLEDIKTVINAGINEEVSAKILTGLKIDNQTVYLSVENQLNYQAAYYMAVADSSSLPITLKFGEDYYKTFSTVEEITSFFFEIRTYINSVLSEGWEKKKSIDYTLYEKLLADTQG